LINTGRNEITVLDRKGIERTAGNSYGVPEKEYRRLFGWGHIKSAHRNACRRDQLPSLIGPLRRFYRNH
jgi:hypothetical protein